MARKERKAGKAKVKEEAGIAGVATTESELPAGQAAVTGAGAGGDEKPGKLSRKAYDKELERLHVELVKLQQWVVHKG